MNRPEPERVVFHVDMDAFYASIEQLEHPEWRGQPVIVGGVNSRRGVVSTASYEARVFGVRSAMPVSEARRRCPQGIYVAGRNDVYGGYSSRLMDLLGEFSPEVEQISVDEAFLDMTGTASLLGPPSEAAHRLKAEIREKLGLTASVGIAPNKFVAKIASDLNKPNGLTLVSKYGVQAFLDPLPVERLLGVGPKTVPYLHQMGLRTLGQVRACGAEALGKKLGGEFGAHLHALACGEDPRDIESSRDEKSLSHEVTFEEDKQDRDILGRELLDLCDRVARRARGHGLSGRTISLVWRDPDFSRHSRNRTLSEPTRDSSVLYQTTLTLLREVTGVGKARRFRLLGVRLSGFGVEEQLSLFGSKQNSGGVDRAMDAVRDRFGEDAVSRGRNVSP